MYITLHHITIISYHCIIISLYYHIAVLSYHCIIISLYYHITVLSYRCIIISLYYHIILQLVSTWELESIFFEAALIFWTVLLALLTAYGVGSAYVCMLFIVCPLIIRQ